MVKKGSSSYFRKEPLLKPQKARVIAKTLHPVFRGIIVEVIRPLTQEEKAMRFQNPNAFEAFLVISPVPFPHETWYTKESLEFL